MSTLLVVALFWAFLIIAMSLFGIACIRYGVYTSGIYNAKTTLEI
jgi:hypothetical protein